MKRFFLFVFAVTSGVLFFIAGIGGGWWYYTNRPPNITVELLGFASPSYEGTIHWALTFRMVNLDSRDYAPGDWSMRLYDRDGDLVPIPLTLESRFDAALFANESTRISFRTQFTVEEDLFRSQGDMELSGSRTDAERYLANLERFREQFWSDAILIVSESLDFRQRISIKDYYEDELARRQRIFERQGNPIGDPELRARVESTPFCDIVDTFPCRSGSVIIESIEPPSADFSPEEYRQRLVNTPECGDADVYPCKRGDVIIEMLVE